MPVVISIHIFNTEFRALGRREVNDRILSYFKPRKSNKYIVTFSHKSRE